MGKILVRFKLVFRSYAKTRGCMAKLLQKLRCMTLPRLDIPTFFSAKILQITEFGPLPFVVYPIY